MENRIEKAEGYWIPLRDGLSRVIYRKKPFNCSACYSVLDVDMEDGVPTWRFCPRCGKRLASRKEYL